MRLWQHLMNQQAATSVSKTWRYWRIFIQTNNGNTNSVGLGEVELRGTVGGSDLLLTSSPVTSSTASGSLPATNLRDNNTATHWASASGNVTDQWVRFDLATAQTVLQVAMFPRNTTLDSAPKDFIIQGSDDGTTFTDVKAFTNITGWTAAWRTFDL